MKWPLVSKTHTLEVETGKSQEINGWFRDLVQSGTRHYVIGPLLKIILGQDRKESLMVVIGAIFLSTWCDASKLFPFLLSAINTKTRLRVIEMLISYTELHVCFNKYMWTHSHMYTTYTPCIAQRKNKLKFVERI